MILVHSVTSYKNKEIKNEGFHHFLNKLPKTNHMKRGVFYNYCKGYYMHGTNLIW